jgi:hypothetical protein
MQANPGEFDHQTDDEVRADIEILPNYGTKVRRGNVDNDCVLVAMHRVNRVRRPSRSRGASRRRFSQRVRGRDAGKPHMSPPKIYWVVC